MSNAAAAVAPASAEQKPQIDSRREIVETVAVVLALVSLLRMFVAEAFSIPTGSMGPTLLGANRRLECPQCGHTSIVGAYMQASGGPKVAGTICQNCRYPVFAEPRSLNALLGEYGDRVIVSKYGYEFGDPKRWDVVVFIYPAESVPEQNSYPSRTNFIKRLVGLPGEDVVFMYGDAYVKPKGGNDFGIASKTPAAMMATRRVVFDNDEQPKDLVKIGFPPRWIPTEGAGAKASEDRKNFTINGDGSLLYRHLLGGGHREVLPRTIAKDAARTPQLVTDFESYNRPYGPRNRDQQPKDFNDLEFIDNPEPGPEGVALNWVGDLMIECTLDLQALGGEFSLHLTEGTRHYRCGFTFENEKKLRLFQGTKQLAELDNPVTAPGATDVRFANFDDRLVVWINNKLVFGDGIAVAALEPEENGPTKADLEPAKLSFSKLRGEVRHLKLYRDIYYTQHVSPGSDEQPAEFPIGPEDEGSIAVWQKGLQSTMNRVRNLTQGGAPIGSERIFHVKDGHYMMCGDNSPRSFDGRGWGLTSFVPRQCVLGKALVVYYPLNKMPWNLKLVQ